MTTSSREQRTTSQRGMALVAVLLMIAVFLILVGALMENLAREVNITGMHGRSNSALRVAYEGVEAMQYQFELNDAGAAPGVVPGTVLNSFTDADGATVSYSVTVDAQRWTSVLPYYVVHSVGTSGTSTRRVDALLQKMPFSAFNLFTIDEKNNLGGAVVYTNGEQFNGPVYSGGPMLIFYADSSPTIFLNTVTTAQAPRWIPAAPSTCCAAGSDWASIISNKANFQQVSQALTLPTAQDNAAVQWAALAGNPAPTTLPTLPVTPGLYINGADVAGGGGVPLTTGLYIAGKAQVTSVGDAVLNTDTFTFLITSGATSITYHVKVDYGANTTTVTDAVNNPVATYTGVPTSEQAPGVTGSNGAIWASQGMDLLAGNTYHGKFTLAVPDTASNHPQMTVAGSQTYADPTKDELAFWANDIVLTDQSPDPNGNIEIDGLLLTGYYGECSTTCTDGTFYNKYCGAITCSGNSGTLTLFGSLIENVRGKRGTLGTSITGFATDGIFDPRLARNPPPFTPTTTAYTVIALCTADQGTTCGQ
jgi:type II secretory pathway pseudopilin PulG